MIDIIRTIDGLRALERDWDHLAAAVGSPLLQFDWFATCASLYPERALYVVTVRASGRLTGVAPLVEVRRSLGGWLEILGASILHEPAGLLAEDETALAELFEAMKRSGYPILLSRLPLDSSIQRLAAKRPGRHAVTIVRRTRGACHVNLTADWPAFENAMRTRARKNLRNTRRRAESAGTVTVESYCPRPETLADDLARAFRIEASSWKGRSGSALLQKDALRRFFEGYSTRCCRDGRLRLFFYNVAGRSVAMRIAVEHARRLWFLKEGYDESCAVMSPGIQLTHETLRWASEHGLEGCEFLGSEEEWQRTWPVEVRPYCSILMYPWSLRGVLGTLGTALTGAGNRLHRGSPATRGGPSRRARAPAPFIA